MDWKNYFYCVLKGLIGSIAVTVILTAILFAVFSQRNPVCMIVYHKETL